MSEKPQKNKLTIRPAILTFSPAVHAYDRKLATTSGMPMIVLFRRIFKYALFSIQHLPRGSLTHFRYRDTPLGALEFPQYHIGPSAAAYTAYDAACTERQNDETDV